jgi:uncharacterized protein with NRDE domain
MCSVSWLRGHGTLLVVMNRDERRDRAVAREPRAWPGRNGGFTAPEDGDAGGTWIAARRSGVVLALLNHHAPRGAAVAAPPNRLSRGLLVTTLAAEDAVPDATRLRAAGLTAFAPFRLFVASVADAPRVFTWNGVRLISQDLARGAGFLTSSSWNPRAVIAARQASFRACLRAHPRPAGAELIAFHDRSDHPRGSPWAICMARDDARTVSTTVVEVTPGGVTMTYRAR